MDVGKTGAIPITKSHNATPAEQANDLKLMCGEPSARNELNADFLEYLCAGVMRQPFFDELVCVRERRKDRPFTRYTERDRKSAHPYEKKLSSDFLGINRWV